MSDAKHKHERPVHGCAAGDSHGTTVPTTARLATLKLSALTT